MKLVPSDPAVNLYHDGFEPGDRDILNRRPVGQSLSRLLNDVETPLVVALNGQWGTGKTYFLKRWVGEHLKEHEGAVVIYFDAFAQDYFDDPLSALVSALDDRIPSEQPSALNSVKKAGVQLARPLLRAGLALATSGTSEILGATAGAVAGAFASEADDQMQNRFWNFEKDRRAAMKEFRNALEKFTSPENDSQNKTNVIFAIDELDRCRPDYALELLEVIKHFFSVPHLHFVLGVNLPALEAMVRTRYGTDTDIDAQTYLGKFIQVTLELPDEITINHRQEKAILPYLDHLVHTMAIKNYIGNPLRDQVEVVVRNNPVSLRDIGKIVSDIALASSEVTINPEGKNFFIGRIEVMNDLIIAKIIRPDLYPGMLHATITPDEIKTYFGVTENIRDRKVSWSYHRWFWLVRNGQISADDPDAFNHEHLTYISETFGSFTSRLGQSPKNIPLQIHRQWLDRFSFYQ